MRKLKYVLLGIFAMLIYSTKVNALEILRADTYADTYVTKINSKGDFSTQMRKYISSDTNGFIFSTEPYKIYSKNHNHNIIQDIANIDEFDRVIAYEADKFYMMDHDEDWYRAAQDLIWQNHKDDGEYSINNDRFINKELILLGLYEQNTLSPLNVTTSYDSKTDSITIEDTNDILKYYDILYTSDSNLSYNKIDSKINITASKDNDTVIYLRRSFSDKNYDMEFYTNSECTDFISSGNFYLDRKLVIEPVSFYAVVNVPSALENFDVSYGLYQNNKLIYTFDITKPGIYKSKALKQGKYTLKQIVKNNNYAYDNNEYIIDIGNADYYFTVNEVEELKGTLVINNKNLNGSIFIYDANDNLAKEFNEDDSNLEVTLPYGNYYITYGNSEKLNLTISNSLVNIEIENLEQKEEAEEKEETYVEETIEETQMEEISIEQVEEIDNLSSEVTDIVDKIDISEDESIEVPDTFRNSLFYSILFGYIVKKMFRR